MKTLECGAEQSDVNQELDSLARYIKLNKLNAPAIFILEMYKPLSNVLYNFSLLTMPLLLGIFGMDRYRSALKVLNSQSNIELLIRMIEEKQPCGEANQ